MIKGTAGKRTKIISGLVLLSIISYLVFKTSIDITMMLLGFYFISSGVDILDTAKKTGQNISLIGKINILVGIGALLLVILTVTGLVNV